MAQSAGLQAYGDLLRELNRELASRFDELPADVRALLIQKGAITRKATDEMGMMIAECGRYVEAYDKLLKRCRNWLDTFFLPLQAQCADEEVPNRVDTRDLSALIEEIEGILTRADVR